MDCTEPCFALLSCLVICHAENNSRSYMDYLGERKKLSPCTENLGAFDRPAHPHSRGELREGKKDNELEE